MKSINIFFISSLFYFLMGLALSLKGQTVLNTCQGLSASPDALSNPAWRYKWGKWHDKYHLPVIDYEYTTFNAARYQILSGGFVPDITVANIPNVRPGGQYSYKLGNNDDGRGYEKMSTSFLVEPENTMLLLHFAIFLQDPSHSSWKNPKFEVKVYNKSGLIDCGTYSFISGYDNTDWPYQKKYDIRYLPWRSAAIDLRKYLGETVTIELATYDCSEGGHFGYALFDIECFNSAINTTAYCTGKDTLTAIGPPGFDTYLWSNGDSTRTTIIQNPQPGQTIWLKLRPVTLNSSCELYMEYNIEMTGPVSIKAGPPGCEGETIPLTVEGPSGMNTIMWSHNGATTPNTEASQSGDYAVTVNYDGCLLSDSINIAQFPNPKFHLVPTPPSCHDTQDASVQIEFDEAFQNPSYNWNNQLDSASIQNIGAGTYTVTVYNALTGCKAVQSIAMQAPLPTPLVMTPSAKLCENNNIFIKASGDFIGYEWPNGSNLDEISVNLEGIYTVTGTDTNGCKTIGSLQIEQFPNPKPSVYGDSTLCPGATTTLSVKPANLTYEWSDNSTGSNIVGSTGIYTVTATDGNGCRGMASFSISTVPNPVADIVSDQPVICESTPVWLTAWVDHPVTDFHWSGLGQTNNPIQVYQGGSYAVTVTDAEGCTGTAVIDMPLSPAQKPLIDGQNAFCTNDSTILSTTGKQIQDILWSTGVHGQFLPVVVSGWYQVSIQDSSGCWWRSDSMFIIENSLPQLQVVHPDSACEKEVVPAMVNNAAWQSVWSNGATTPSTNLPPGDFSVTVTDENGCTAVETGDIVKIPLRKVHLSVSDTAVCDGTPIKITLTVSGKDGHAWLDTPGGVIEATIQDNQAFWNMIPSASMIAKLSSLNVSGYSCAFVGLPTEVFVKVHKLNAIVSSKVGSNGFGNPCFGDHKGALEAQVAYNVGPCSYQWSGNIANGPHPENLPAGMYTVTITDAYLGCTAELDAEITEPAPFRPTISTIPLKCNWDQNAVIAIDDVNGAQGKVYAQVNGGLKWPAPGKQARLGPGDYWVHIVDGFGCPFDTLLSISQPPFYFAEIGASELQIPEGNTEVFNTITNIPNPEPIWVPALGLDNAASLRPSVTPLNTTLYVLYLTSPEGCILTDTVRVIVQKDRRVYGPNIITPKRSTENSVFFLSVQENAVDIIEQLQIFDRWGNLVFQKENIHPNDPFLGWEGQYGGRFAAPGVYIWRAVIKYKDGSTEQYKGDVTVWHDP